MMGRKVMRAKVAVKSTKQKLRNRVLKVPAVMKPLSAWTMMKKRKKRFLSMI